MTRGVCMIVASMLAVGVEHSPQQPVYRARTSAVRVDVLVTERGHPVKGLGADDFDVRDNGVRQNVDFLLLESLPVSLAVVLDVSGSVAGERLEHFRGAVDRVLDNLTRDDRVALVSFRHEISMLFPAAVDRERLRTRLDDARGSGATSLFDAAYAGLVLSDRDDERGLLLIFSDGRDTSSWLTPARVLDTAKRGQAVSYAVSPGGSRNRFLRDLVNLTGGSLLEVESTKDLGNTFAGILDEFRQRYLLSYSPTGVAADGWHRIDVSVRRPGVTVKARTGYLVAQ
jgi:Ca-activated chloride channel family protein